ncbi:MAG: amylo-alpha-1,6-glucosidase, partial [Ktedonobacteraceae bacterium]
NEYRDGTLNPSGFVHLESFRLEEGCPIFTYRLGGIDGVTLEKRIWMLQGQNTTCIQYRVLCTSTRQSDAENISWRGSRPGSNGYSRFRSHMEAARPSLTLTLLPLVAHRPYDQPQHGGANGQFEVHTRDTGSQANEFATLPPGMAGCTIQARNKATPYHILASGNPACMPQFLPTGVWYWHFLRRHDRAAGLPDNDDLYLPGVIRARLAPDQTLTIIVTAEELMPDYFEPRRLNQLYEQALDYQRGLLAARSYFGEGGGTIQTLPVLPLTASIEPTIDAEEFLQLLHQAGDHFLTRRTLPHREHIGAPAFFARADEHIPTITPGYYHVADHTREALIALPGLTITSRRYSEAQRSLRFLARNFRQGLLPNRLPTVQRPRLEDEDYGSVDTSLWYCYALDKYLSATHDYELLDELYPRLEESLACYIRGSSHGIQLDSSDGLLRTGTPERALTWMNALDQGKPITPRT